MGRGEIIHTAARGDVDEVLVLHLLLGEVGAHDGPRGLTGIVGSGCGVAHLDVVVDSGLGIDTAGEEGVGIAAAEEDLVAAGGVDALPLHGCGCREGLHGRVVVGQVALGGVAPGVGAGAAIGDGAVIVFVDSGVLGHDAGGGSAGIVSGQVGGVEDGAVGGYIGQRHLSQVDAVELTAQGLSVSILLGHLPLEVVLRGSVVEAYVVLVQGGTVPDEGAVVGVVDRLHGCGVEVAVVITRPGGGGGAVLLEPCRRAVAAVDDGRGTQQLDEAVVVGLRHRTVGDGHRGARGPVEA